MNIIGGRMLFRRTVKPADFEGKGGEVELSFSIAEGEDCQTALGMVDKLIHERVMRMIHRPDYRPDTGPAVGALTDSVAATIATDTEAALARLRQHTGSNGAVEALRPALEQAAVAGAADMVPTGAAHPQSGQTPAEAVRRYRRSKAEIEADEARDAAGKTSSMMQPPVTAASSADGASSGDAAIMTNGNQPALIPAQPTPAETAIASPGPAQDAAAMMPAAEVAAVTQHYGDTDLDSAVLKAREAGVPVIDVRLLIGEMCIGLPAVGMYNIPDDKRPAFVNALRTKAALVAEMKGM